MTAIQWTDATWNPVTGCTRVSAGCAHCYIERTPPMRMARRRFERVEDRSTTGVHLHPERLERRLPTGPRIFVCSMADLFHDEVPTAYLDEVFGTIAADALAEGGRTFQVLTKRPERMRDYFRSDAARLGIYKRAIERAKGLIGTRILPWPLPNLWLGVSIENARYNHRADILRTTPAAVRFISAEPLLGSLLPDRDPLDVAAIDWLIVGGESGPGARPMHLDWARELVDLAIDADVAPFVKQLGASPIGEELELRDRKGGDWDEWPADLKHRAFPTSGRRRDVLQVH